MVITQLVAMLDALFLRFSVDHKRNVKIIVRNIVLLRKVVRQPTSLVRCRIGSFLVRKEIAVPAVIALQQKPVAEAIAAPFDGDKRTSNLGSIHAPDVLKQLPVGITISACTTPLPNPVAGKQYAYNS